MPTKTVGLLESVTVKDEDEITGALDPFPTVSSMNDLICCSGRLAALNVCLFTVDLPGTFLRTEQGRHEKVDCGGTA